MSNELQIHIPQNQPELEAAILQFLQDEFQQDAHFQNENSNTATRKDMSALDILWQVVSFVAVVEGGLQFAERARRLERVKKLEAAIKRAGKPVYIRIKGQSIDLYQKSADQIMNLLAGDSDKLDE